MKLVVVRHGRDGAGGGLSEIGRDQIRRLAAAVRRAGLVPTLLMSSQIDRASQSAAVLAEEFARVSGGPPLEVNQRASLHQDCSGHVFIRELPKIALGHEVVVAVTHMPIVKDIGFATGYEPPPDVVIENASGIVVDVNLEVRGALTFLQTIAPEVP